MVVHPEMILGSILGSLAAVRLFLLIGGVWFSTGRQIFAAYLALGIAAVFMYAAGLADGGPPNYSGAPLQIFGVTLGAVIEWALLAYRARRRTATTA